MPPGDVLWLGPPAPWADALGPVRTLDDAADLGSVGALAVVGSGHVGDVADWLGRPASRPPVLVVADDGDAEAAALRAGADDVLRTAASRDEAARAARRARARHAAACEAAHDAELYRLVVESATSLVVVTDARGRVVYASPSVGEQVGRAPGALVGTPALDLVHPDDAGAAGAALADVLAAPGAARPLRVRVRTAGGDVRAVEGVARAASGAGGAPVGVVTARDVTDRQETERRLRESEARFRTVVGALPDVVARLRLDGRVLDFHVPPAFETEFPAERLVGRRLQDVIPSALADKFEAAVARVRQTGRPVSYDYVVRVGGVERHREVRLAPVGEGETISMLRDVTALREKGAALERSEAELRALAAHLQDVREEERARLSREVHDVLGQQLTAIRLSVGWFGRHSPDDADAQARLDDVRETIDETLGHVRQIAADLRPGVLDDFGLESAVEWQAARFERRTGVPCALAVVGDTEPPADVATAAFRVLQEALTNVARHAGAGSVAVTLGLRPDAVELAVADDGRGFDADAAGRQSLGLLGMRERARALGGALSVRGRPGEGTTVECTFPLNTSAAP